MTRGTKLGRWSVWRVRLGLKGTADYYADDSPERNRRQKKRAGLNTAGVSNSYDDEVAGLTSGTLRNDDDADDDAIFSNPEPAT